MDTEAREILRLDLRSKSAGTGHLFQTLCVCTLLVPLLTRPLFAQGAQSSAAPPYPSGKQGTTPVVKPSMKPQKDSVPAQSFSQESNLPQAKHQTPKSGESTPKGDDGTEKNDPVKKTVSSLILTVKLALLADPRLFPYEIDVEAASNDITLLGKVPAETEKAAAATVASAVPTVKSVTNKLEVTKELPEVLVQKQDDIITHHVKEQFAKSATVTAANFDVKTEQGVVSLSGAVRFQVIVLEAAEAARNVPGVKAVKTDKVRIESEG